MQRTAAQAGAEWGDLLSSVAEQLKVPLTIIARQADLGEMTGDQSVLSPTLVRVQADAALQLVDCYLLGLELLRGQTQLEIEPVSVSSTLADVAHALTRYAKQYNVAIRLALEDRCEPVMAHGRGLRAALLSLGFGMIETQAGQEGAAGSGRQVLLAMHRTPHGIISGVYGKGEAVNTAQWRTALQLMGRAPQPFTGLSSSAGAGLFVADTIFRGMDSQLRTGLWQRHRGLAAMLQPSRQLRFV